MVNIYMLFALRCIHKVLRTCLPTVRHRTTEKPASHALRGFVICDGLVAAMGFKMH